ncbi:MAG: hypothetical protein ACI8S6_002957 [Myxococcota bacterium]|jgi:hypothetical protein
MLTALSTKPQLPTQQPAQAPASPAAGFLDLLKAAEAPPLDAPEGEGEPLDEEGALATAPLPFILPEPEPEPETTPLPTGMLDLEAEAELEEVPPELSLYQLSMAALPEPALTAPSDAPPQPMLTPLSLQLQPEADAEAPEGSEDGGEGSEPLPEASAAPESSPAPVPSPAPVLSADLQVMEPEVRPTSARAVGAESLPPPPAEVAVESGDDSQLLVRHAGLDKLSLRVQDGGDRIDVEIEKGIDRSLDVRVIVPPDAVDELSSMETELQRSLEERALKLGSYSMEARDPEAEEAGEGAAGAAGEGGEGEGEESDGEVVAEHVWQLGLLNIRA